LLHIGAILGVMTVLTPLIGSDLLDRGGPTVAGLMTAGMLGGMYAAHREWVRPYQHTTGDAAITSLGTAAGALAGMGLVVLASPSDQVSWAMVTAGSILGSIAGHRTANPARAVASNRTSSVDGPSTRRRASVEFTPGSLALAAAGVPGHHAALTIRF
jgi:hypothetical protein